MLSITLVDAVLDALAHDEPAATALAQLVTLHGAWLWDAGSAHDESLCLTILASTGAYWCVSTGAEGPQAWRFEAYDDAASQMDRMVIP